MAKSKDKLVEYVLEVNKNKDLLEKHEKDPEAAARAYGLDDKDVKLILSEDYDKIEKRFKQAGESHDPSFAIATHTP